MYAYARTYEEDTVAVVLNPRLEQPRMSVSVKHLSPSKRWMDVLSGTEYNENNGVICFEPLQAASVHVLIAIQQ